MKITEIKAERGHLYKVIFDNGKIAFLDKDYCIEKGLRQETEIDNDTLKTFVKESDYRRALSRAVWYIERGSMSARKLFEKLRQASFQKETTEKVVIRMTELGLINDAAFAERLAEEYLSRCVSVREAEQKMISKGLDRETVKAALDLFEVDPCQQIKSVINKNYRQKLVSEEGIKKVFAALQRKGFNYSDIKRVLAEYSEQLRYSEE